MRTNWLQRRLGLPDTAIGDDLHRQTRQPDAGAMSYAYIHLGLPLYSPIGSADEVRGGGFLTIQPQGYQLQHVPLNGLGGVQAGQPMLTALLISQAEAVARGLAVTR